MILFHTSDWHLGRMLRGRSLIEDQRYFLQQIFLPAVQRERPACVLLAGDIYDRQVASPEAIRLFDSVLDRLTQLGCKVLAISGNHDGADRIAILKKALQKSGVYLATQPEDALEPVLLEEEGLAVQVFLLPYFDPVQAREFFRDDSLRGEGQCMERMLEELKKQFLPGAKHILVSHCFAAGASVCDSESIFVGGSGQVPPALFADFDYVALGHLHGPQKAGENARYSGSPLKYSISEAGQKKGFLRLTAAEEGIQAEHVPVAPLRDVRAVRGLFADLEAEGQASPCDDYLDISLEDPAPVLMAAERLRPCYPNLLEVRNQWAVLTEEGQSTARLKGLSREDLFLAFMRDICGTEAEEEDLALFREVLGEIGQES